MSEQSQHNDSLPQAEAEQDVVVLIRKMQHQLVSLEKKIDILISQSQAKPFREKHFSKPFRSFGYSQRRPDREYEENRGFSHKKKVYDNSQKSDFGQEHHFKKRYGGEKRNFDQKKKPIFYKRKDQG